MRLTTLYHSDPNLNHMKPLPHATHDAITAAYLAPVGIPPCQASSAVTRSTRSLYCWKQSSGISTTHRTMSCLHPITTVYRGNLPHETNGTAHARFRSRSPSCSTNPKLKNSLPLPTASDKVASSKRSNVAQHLLRATKLTS